MDRINNICSYKSIGHTEFISGSYEMALTSIVSMSYFQTPQRSQNKFGMTVTYSESVK
jgi:hypothetical protein